MRIRSNEPHVSSGDTEFCIDLAVIVIFMSWKDEPFKPRFGFHRLFDVHPLLNRGQLFVEYAIARWDD